jgi:hypothetical protein
MDEILYRQDVLKDFVSCPELIERLTALSLRFCELAVSHVELEREARGLKRTSTASRDASKNILQAQALCLKRALMFVKAFGEALCEYDLHSKGLVALRSFCTEIYEKKEYAELLRLCKKYESFSECGYWDFRFVFSDDGYIESYDLVDRRFIRITDPELKRKGISFRRKREECYPCARLYPKNDGYFDSLAVSALSELSMLFSGISKQIFERLGSLDGELDFYSVALNMLSQQTVEGYHGTIKCPDFSRVCTSETWCTDMFDCVDKKATNAWLIVDSQQTYQKVSFVVLFSLLLAMIF